MESVVQYLIYFGRNSHLVCGLLLARCKGLSITFCCTNLPAYFIDTGCRSFILFLFCALTVSGSCTSWADRSYTIFPRTPKIYLRFHHPFHTKVTGKLIVPKSLAFLTLSFASCLLFVCDFSFNQDKQEQDCHVANLQSATSQ